MWQSGQICWKIGQCKWISWFSFGWSCLLYQKNEQEYGVLGWQTVLKLGSYTPVYICLWEFPQPQVLFLSKGSQVSSIDMVLMVLEIVCLSLVSTNALVKIECAWISLDEELMLNNCLVETCAKLRGADPGCDGTSGGWLGYHALTGCGSLYLMLKLVWCFLGHSGQQISVKCADQAMWITSQEDVAHFKSSVFFVCLFVYLFFL